MSHPFTITDQLIDDTLCTALEGGINYWADSATPDAWPEGVTYASDAVTKGAALVIAVNEDDDNPGVHLDRAAMVRGIRRYCKEFHTTPANLDDDPVDASGADAIVQYAVFGELVYA